MPACSAPPPGLTLSGRGPVPHAVNGIDNHLRIAVLGHVTAVFHNCQPRAGYLLDHPAAVKFKADNGVRIAVDQFDRQGQGRIAAIHLGDIGQ